MSPMESILENLLGALAPKFYIYSHAISDQEYLARLELSSSERNIIFAIEKEFATLLSHISGYLPPEGRRANHA